MARRHEGHVQHEVGVGGVAGTDAVGLGRQAVDGGVVALAGAAVHGVEGEAVDDARGGVADNAGVARGVDPQGLVLGVEGDAVGGDREGVVQVAAVVHGVERSWASKSA